MSYIEKINKVRIGPFDPKKNIHNILHPETEDEVVLVDINTFSQKTRNYFNKTGQTPKTLEDVISLISSVSFGDDIDTTDIINELKTYINDQLNNWTINNHKTTYIDISVVFNGTSGTNRISCYSDTSEYDNIIGNSIDSISNINWKSIDKYSDINALYIGTNPEYSKEKFKDILIDDANSGILYDNSEFKLSNIDLSIITASKSLSSINIYFIGRDKISGKLTDTFPIKINFRKPMFYWTKQEWNETVESFDKYNESGYIDNTPMYNDDFILNKPYKLISSNLIGTTFSVNNRRNYYNYHYIALPYSPYYSHLSNDGTMFFGGTNSSGTALINGYDVSSRIRDNYSGFTGGWVMVSNELMITLPNGYSDRYCIYRTENSIHPYQNYSQTFTISDFDINPFS